MKRVAKFILAFKKLSDPLPRADEDDLLAEKVRWHAGRIERFAVGHIRNGERRTVVTNPALVGGVHRPWGLRIWKVKPICHCPRERAQRAGRKSAQITPYHEIIVKDLRIDPPIRSGPVKRLVGGSERLR